MLLVGIVQDSLQCHHMNGIVALVTVATRKARTTLHVNN